MARARGGGGLDPGFKVACDAVGRLIAPADTPRWLTKYLVHWSTPLASKFSVALLQPTKTEMKKQLTNIGNAADLLNNVLSDPMTRAFLEREFHFEIDKEFAGFRRALPLIAARAHKAARSPALSKQSGKTRRGRGKALLPGTYNPKIFCALVIAEAWKFIHGKYPTPVNRTAANAAEDYWQASGGSTDGWNDRLGAWRPYFQNARGPQVAVERAE